MHRFGRSGLWWLVLILASSAVLLWEVGVQAVRIAWWPSEVEIFQELERDPYWSGRFREVACPEGDLYERLREEDVREGRKKTWRDVF